MHTFHGCARPFFPAILATGAGPTKPSSDLHRRHAAFVQRLCQHVDGPSREWRVVSAVDIILTSERPGRNRRGHLVQGDGHVLQTVQRVHGVPGCCRHNAGQRTRLPANGNFRPQLGGMANHAAAVAVERSLKAAHLRHPLPRRADGQRHCEEGLGYVALDDMHIARVHLDL